MPNATAISMVKLQRASSVRPSPCRRAIIALPPVPSIMPVAICRQLSGYDILIAESAVVPANREINMPSTMVYIDSSIIIAMFGSANRSSDAALNLRASALFCSIANLLFKRIGKFSGHFHHSGELLRAHGSGGAFLCAVQTA